MNKNQYQLAVKYILLTALFFIGNAQSANFSINPLRLYLDGKVRSGTVVVENTSDELLTIQASINFWSQQDGKDDLIIPTEEMVVSPPIFKVQPKSRQIIRVGNLKKPDTLKEGAYRLVLEEVPHPRKPDETGTLLVLRISLPIFITPVAANTQALLKWKVTPVDAKNISLTFVNSGTAHIQINGISVNLPDGSSLVAIPSMMTYILPAQSHTFKR